MLICIHPAAKIQEGLQYLALAGLCYSMHLSPKPHPETEDSRACSQLAFSVLATPVPFLITHSCLFSEFVFRDLLRDFCFKGCPGKSVLIFDLFLTNIVQQIIE